MCWYKRSCSFGYKANNAKVKHSVCAVVCKRLFQVTEQEEEDDPTSYPARSNMNMFPGTADATVSRNSNDATLSTHQ